MPIGRPFDETAVARAARDSEFARGLLVEAISVLVSEPEVASVLIGHYIDGTGGTDHLAVAMGMPGSDTRSAILDPTTTPFITFMRGLEALCKAEGLLPLLSCLAPANQPSEEWTPAHHKMALMRIDELMNAESGSADAMELAVLGKKVAVYERLRFSHRKPTLTEKIQNLFGRISGRKAGE